VSAAVRIWREILSAMHEEASKAPTQECCGVLAGRDGIITHILPATNALASATAYEIAPQELFRVMKEIRTAELHMMGIYHSHPAGENRPSRSDVERAFYPETPYFILSPLPDAPQPVRAFSIREGEVAELTIQPV
jgi:[CysO sulfur-carrier protein]-S-L-cysteine hydrolase